MRNFAFAAAVCLLLSGCAHRADLVAVEASDPKPYVRVRSLNSNLLELQIAVRRFEPVKTAGPAVWLSAVSHLGEPQYYSELQEHLSQRTLVLFEGIQGGQGKLTPQKGETSGGLQAELARSLGLVFQMDAMEYDRQNFRNSDLSIAQIRELLVKNAGQGPKSEAESSFDSLLQTMRGESDFSGAITYILKLVGGHQGLQGLGRLALLELLGAIGGDPGKISGLPDSMKQVEQVLLEGRNDAVFTDLKAALPDLEKDESAALFYGAAHMPNLERRLRQELSYRPSREVWLTAFSVDIARAGITPAQREFIRGFVRSHLVSE